MKKKRLLGKVLSLVLSAAMTVTMLPQDFTLTVRAAEQIEADGEMESQTSTSEEESLEAEPSEPAQESSIAKEKETESSTAEKTEEENGTAPGTEESSSVKETETESVTKTEEESSTVEETERETEEEEKKPEEGEPAASGNYAGPMIGSDGKVTFQYDASKETDPVNTIQVKGSWVSSWDDLIDLKDEDGDKIWSVTVGTDKITLDKTIEYGFQVNDSSGWRNDEANPFKGSGNAQIFRNPVINAETGDVTIYRYPASADENITSIQLGYKLTGADTYTKVDMDAKGKGYLKTLTGLTEGEYEYGFFVDGSTTITPDTNCSEAKFTVQVVNYPDENPDVKSPVLDVAKGEVTFNLYKPTAKEVKLAGTMMGSDDWGASAVPMTYDSDTGYWSITKALAPGRYEYKFIVDSAWITDPLNSEESRGNSTFFLPDPSGKISPEIDGRNVTFIYKDDTASDVKVAGTMTDPQWNEGALSLDKDETDGLWKLTMEDVAPGKYQYKFVVTAEGSEEANWVADPWNSKPQEDTNSIFAIAGMANASVILFKDKGKVELPANLNVYDENGNATETAVTYSFAATETIPADGVKIETIEGVITVGITETFPKDITEFTLTAASADGQKSTMTVEVMEKEYTYNIYWYSYEGHTNEDSALWVWEQDGRPGKEIAFDSVEQIGEHTWIKAELKLPYTSLGIIPKIKSEDPSSPVWTWQDSNHLYVNKDLADVTTLYIVEGISKPYTEVPEIEKREARYLIVEYIRNEDSAENWYFYTWNNGGTEFNPFVKTEDNKWIATVPVKWGLTSISYCLERADMATGEPVHWAEKDGNDYLCEMPADQNIVKIVMEEGKGITKTYAYNKGYEIEPLAGRIHFYFRDNNKFQLGNDGGYASVQVEINGQAYDMTFDNEEQRYAYDMTDLQPGEYRYRYILKETEESETQYILDAYNKEKVTDADSGIEYSVCKYEKFDLDVSAKVLNASMDYNDNNVLTVSFTGKDGANVEGMKADHATADLSALGGASDAAIDTELLALSIAVKEGTATGEKTIPVTVYDQYKNEYKAETKVTVTERDKSGDFDWDEAVIYFAVTDRFFDGNTSNNANVDKNGPSSYHGGDFAGMTQKLDYLKDLGINTIWITPIVDNSMEKGLETDVEGVTSWGYHGYWASNFEKIDDHLGTEEEFRALLNAAHDRGIKIMVDVVLNHSGYGETTKNYFNETFKDADGNAIRMLREADEEVSGSDQMTSLSGLPDFLTENSEVRELLVAWQSNWISKYPIDYYRVDTVKHVDDTTWSAFKNALTTINPDFKMIGEWAGAGYATDTGMLGTGRMDSLLDFDFNDQAQSFANGNLSSVESFLQGRNGALNNTATLGQFMSSHDEDGLIQKLISENKISEDRAMELFKVVASLQITAKGQPVIYYGEEVGQYGANNYPYQTNRYDFDWSRVNDDNTMLNHYKKLLEIRNHYPQVFAKGNRSTVTVNNDAQYDVFSRSYGDTVIYVGLNNAQRAQSVTFQAPAAVYQDLYSGEFYNTDEKGALTVEIPAAADGGTVMLLKTEYDPNNLWVSRIPDQTYTGSAIKLDSSSLVVRLGGRRLQEGKDFTVSYKNNKNASTDSTKATVTIKGKGNFTEQKTVEFNIAKKNIDSQDVVLTCNDVLAYNANKAQNAAPKLKYGKISLKVNKDYTASYYAREDYDKNPAEATALTSIKDEGNYVMVINAAGNNYTGSIVKDVIITKKNPIKGAAITLSASSVSYADYDDEQKRPKVTKVKIKGKELDTSAYDVSYLWNGQIGTATAVVTVKADNTDYIGSAAKTFKVTGDKLGSVAMVDAMSIKDMVYEWASADTAEGITQEAPALKAKSGTDTFEAGRDYTVSYKNNKKVGKATVTFTGKGRYTGTISATFKINGKELKKDDITLICPEEAPYSKAGSTPEITVNYGGKVLGKNDYKVSYSNNKALTESATAQITFKGNYKGTVTAQYKVIPQNLENTVVTVKDVMYNVKPEKFLAVPTVKESNGKALKAGTDYKKECAYSYVNQTTVANSGQENIVREAGEAVVSGDVMPVGTQVKLTISAPENGNYTGSKSVVYNIMKADIAKAKIKLGDKEYTGYAVNLTESDFTEFKMNGTVYTVQLNGTTATLVGADGKPIDGGFEIISYTGNVNKGTAKVTLKGTGSFGGTITRTFKIKANNVKENWFEKLARMLFH